ncbi:hypothetical protein BB561_002552 [Smittium simulii]|uniref:18S rRNA factor 2 n=1 Tax=Smittium simulii TaxID=133385 RepID=A0A2T9YQ97_9FUNG|nr:hypothetical protein BB561_002552 [Smittium simulii]
MFEQEEYDDLIYNSSSTEKDLDSSEEEAILGNLYYLDDNQNIKQTLTGSSNSGEHNLNSQVHAKQHASNQQPAISTDTKNNSLDYDSDSKYSFPSKNYDSSILPTLNLDDNADKIENNKDVPAFDNPTKPSFEREQFTTAENIPYRIPITQVLEITPAKKRAKIHNNSSELDNSDVNSNYDNDYSYLDEAQYSAKNRYYVEKKEKLCLICGQTGHIKKDCPNRQCVICGLSGHKPSECKNQATICHNCNQRGHISANCPNPNERYGPSKCNRCNSKYHHSEECSTIWRNYSVIDTSSVESYNIIKYCYNCASDAHFGDNCHRKFPFWSNYEDNTAFSSSNLQNDYLSGYPSKSNKTNQNYHEYSDYSNNSVSNEPNYKNDAHSPDESSIHKRWSENKNRHNLNNSSRDSNTTKYTKPSIYARLGGSSRYNQVNQKNNFSTAKQTYFHRDQEQSYNIKFNPPVAKMSKFFDLNEHLKPSNTNDFDESDDSIDNSDSESENFAESSRASIINPKKRNFSSDVESDEQSDFDHKELLTTQENKTNPEKSESKKQKIKPLTKEESLVYQKKEKKTGVVYMSRVPPFMKPNKVRRLLEQYGQIGKIFLAPEDPLLRKRRIKQGGSKRKGFVEGWIEFKDKKIARAVAKLLNNQNIGGKKRSYHYEMLWNLKYLPKFKWRNLTEQLAFERVERDQRLRNEVNQARNETNDFIQKVERAKAIKGMEAKKAAKAGRNNQSSESNVEIKSKPKKEYLPRSEFNKKTKQSLPKDNTSLNDVLSKLL